MLLSTAGQPGPVMVKRLGKPATTRELLSLLSALVLLLVALWFSWELGRGAQHTVDMGRQTLPSERSFAGYVLSTDVAAFARFNVVRVDRAGYRHPRFDVSLDGSDGGSVELESFSRSRYGTEGQANRESLAARAAEAFALKIGRLVRMPAIREDYVWETRADGSLWTELREGRTSQGLMPRARWPVPGRWI